MLNSFPQGSADPDVLIATFEKATAHIGSAAISEAARRFTCGEVKGANLTFAPSVAEFVQECKRVPTEHVRLPKPAPQRRMPDAERLRMRLKMPMYNHATRCGLMDQLDAANKAGFSAMISLAHKWGVPIPEELLSMPGDDAELQWADARRRAWVKIERNPRPFLRRQRAKVGQ